MEDPVKKFVIGALLCALIACTSKESTTVTTDTTGAATGTSATVMTETAITTTTETAMATGTSAMATGTAPATTTSAAAPPAAKEKPMTENTEKVAEIKTTKGDIHIRFFPDKAPKHVQNFLDLAQQGYYNGTKFHRVIPGFMIQGGDPNTKNADVNTWGMGGNGSNRLTAEFNQIPHKRGIVSMARSQDPNSASSQFFIVVADSRFLDNQYTVFGEVTKGMDVADQIVSAPKGANDRPNDPVAITGITVRAAKDNEKGPAPKG